jgi:hypothetical protein
MKTNSADVEVGISYACERFGQSCEEGWSMIIK